MKREDVKNKITGITEEQPNWLMQENGSDITREKFLSTLSLRRATKHRACGGAALGISIHALLAESDSMTHMLRCCASIFLSTLSLQRATHIADNLKRCYPHFYPRSPCGERQKVVTVAWVCI